ncbi:cell wall anchor protein [Nannocystis sp. ILAH1]|uniref:cell wall anchor protein n=1 Tax=Nannocystis sp. ILAH1 TaxID=2996789 RepID=UPI00226D8F0A|nr:cell wall anchor protein [Nannocystis sp. ILAH1]MCY0988760.1 cell wall anchor protein [Nannocystis sp. ILAH1]
MRTTTNVIVQNTTKILCSAAIFAWAGCEPLDGEESGESTAETLAGSEGPSDSETGVEAGLVEDIEELPIVEPGEDEVLPATPSYRSSAVASGAGLSALTINKPAGVVQGDVLLARVTNRNNATAVVTPPAGWTLLRSDQSASQLKAWVFYKVAGAAEPANYAFSIDLASNIAGSVVAFANVDTANPIDAHSGQKNGLVATFDTPPITTTAAGGVAVWFGSQVWAGTTCPTSPIVPPSGFTEVLDTCLPSAGTALLYDAAYKVLGAAGPQPAFNGSSPYANTNIAQVVALRPAGAPTCTVGDSFAGSYTTIGTVASPAIVEPSGLAASRVSPGVIYVHNEDTTAVVAISASNASTLGTFAVAGVTPADWEDVATGPCPTGKCIFMGDIGRSSANFPTPPSTFAVYRIPEPDVAGGQTSGNLTAEKFPFQYPDSPKDAESIMVHPTTGDIYVITKSSTGLSKAYKMPNPLPAPNTMSTLIFVANLQLPTNGDPNFSYATAAAIHPCANRFLLRTYRTVYEFRAAPNAAFETAFAATPVALTDTVEGQGEAIEYQADGAGYFTMSESPSPFRLKRVARL